MCSLCVKKGGKNDCDGKRGKNCIGNAPPILANNSDSWELFMMAGSQVRDNGTFDYQAMKLVADTTGIEWNEDLFKRIKTIESDMLENMPSQTE